MPIEWRDEMVVDNGDIDNDHKFLIKTINTIETAMKKQMDDLVVNQGLRLLKHYTKVHFQREEELQLHAQYVYRDAHIKEHQELIKKLDDITEQYKVIGISITKKNSILLEFLKDWLINHIINTDLRMRPFVSKMKETKLKPLKKFPPII